MKRKSEEMALGQTLNVPNGMISDCPGPRPGWLPTYRFATVSTSLVFLSPMPNLAPTDTPSLSHPSRYPFLAKFWVAAVPCVLSEPPQPPPLGEEESPLTRPGSACVLDSSALRCLNTGKYSPGTGGEGKAGENSDGRHGSRLLGLVYVLQIE